MLERVKKLATATLGDALDLNGLTGVMSGIARRSGKGAIAGFAVTMHEQIAPFGSFNFGDFNVGLGFDATSKDQVLVVDMGGADVSTFGGLAALTLALRGSVGAVIDGGCRDIEDIAQSGLTVASRFVTPRTGKGRARVVSVGEPVGCGGVWVNPGDLVVIDDTGQVVIPKDQIENIVATAEKLHSLDSEFEERLRSGASFTNAAGNLKHT